MSRRPAAAGYSSAEFPRFAVTVDVAALTIREGVLHVLLVTRGEEPFAGRLALPGGFVRPEEDLAEAAARELAEETGVHQVPGHLEQLATYGSPHRDPRMRVVSVTYLALAPALPDARAGSDAAGAAWVPVTTAQASPLAFDHDVVLADAIGRARAKLEYTSLAAAFCAEEFTISDLRRVYEAVWGIPLDPRNFHRKVTGTPGFLIETGRTVVDGPGRPAALFRSGPTTTLSPPLTRD